jgi:CheY-like chemotaxis protein
MVKTATVYDVLISCPNDVLSFVEKIENAMGRFNNFYGRENGIVLRPISCKNNAFPQFGAHPQRILDEQIVNNSDFCVAVFWTRFGSETDDYGSGTEEEIEQMLADGKQVFLYFLNKPLSPDGVDWKQYSKIQDFKEHHKNKGLFFNVSDEQALESDFREHLELYIDSKIHGSTFKKTKANKLILWVDDCPENNVYIRDILENYGLDFDLALNTNSALKHLKNDDYAMVISDMGRKEGPREGYALLEQMRKSGNDTPFIIFAAHGSSIENKIEAQRMGAQGSSNIVSETVDMVLKTIIKDS